MKKILTLLLVIALALGTFTGCDMIKGLIGGGDNNEVTGPTLDEAKTYLFNIYKDSAAAPVVDYDLVAKVIIDGTSFAVTWTVNNDAITIKESNKANFWTVDLPSKNDAEVAYVLTATITDAEGATVQLTFNKTLPVIDSTGITTTPVEGTAYKLYMVQVNLGQKLYATATDEQDHKYIQTTNDATKAADFYVEKDGDGYKWYTIINGVKNYVYAQGVNNNGKISKYIGFSTENATVFNHVAETNSWQTRIDGTPYCVGTYNTYKTICISEATYITAENTGVSQFVVEFMTAAYANTLTPDAEPETITDSAKVIEKVYGLADGETLGGTFIVTGTITELDSYGNPTIVVAGLEDKPVLCYKLTDDRFVVGATLTVTAKMLKNYKETYELMECTLNNIVLPGNEPAPETQLGVVDLPEVGVAYKLGLFHGNEAADVFFNGNIYSSAQPWYLGFTNNGAEAADVYLETVEGVEGAYRLYFMNGDAKTYIRMYPRDGDTTKGTMELTTTVPAEYFTYSTEHKTLIYTSTTGEQFYMGSSGTYKSISTSAISYITQSTSYPAHFYAAGAGNGGNNGGDTPVDPQPPVDEPITGNEVVFDFGANGAAGTHTDGNDIGATKTYTVGGYELVLTDALKAYDGGFDKAGNSILKFGTSSVAGTVTFVVPSNVNSVVIYAARYKNYEDNNLIVINGTTYTLTGNSDDGAYEAITVDTTSNKTVVIASTTDAAKPRCVVDKIVFILGEGGEAPAPSCEHANTTTTTVDATCTEAGSTTVACNDCGKTVSTTAIAALGHAFVEGICSTCGANEPAAPVYTYPVATELKNGDKIIIGAPAHGKLLSMVKTGYYNVGIDYSADNFANVTDDEIFVVTVNEDGTYGLVSVSGKVLAQGTYSSLDEAGANTAWAIEAKDGADGIFYLKNTGTGKYLEWYASMNNWSTYNGTLSDLFELHFYVVEAGQGGSAPVCEHTNTTTNTVDATCTAAGSTTVVCNDCGKTVSTTAIDATGHNYVDGACSACGAVEVVLPAGTNVADFESFTNGDGKDTSYVDRTNNDGWVLNNGRCDEQTCYGVDYEQIIINGKTTAVGKLTSCTLSGGISSLSFGYGYAFSEANGVSITINIKDTNGNVLATTQCVDASIAKEATGTFTWTLDTAIEGDFVIEIVNNCPSNNTGNKDRYSLWNLTWENA